MFSPPKIVSNTSSELAMVGSPNLATSNFLLETPLPSNHFFIKIEEETLGIIYEKGLEIVLATGKLEESLLKVAEKCPNTENSLEVSMENVEQIRKERDFKFVNDGKEFFLYFTGYRLDHLMLRNMWMPWIISLC